MLSTIRLVARRSTRMASTIAQAYAEGNMTSRVKIIRGGRTNLGWNAATKTVIVDEEDLIWGPGLVVDGDPVPDSDVASVDTVSGPITMALGDEPQYFQQTFISIPLRAPKIPRIDDVVTVLDSDDPKLILREFRVVDVEVGGQVPNVHRMQVVGAEPSKATS